MWRRMGLMASITRRLPSFARTARDACATDAYFPTDNAREKAQQIPNATFKIIPSVLGYWAGVEMNEADRWLINDAIAELLREK
jgi:hypothetical protein